jgi:hypothetical protein
VSEVNAAERAGLLDVLIVEHRHRATIAEGRLASIQTTINAMVTGVVAVAALLAPHLPYRDFDTADWMFIAVSGVAASGILLTWVDALGGPMKRIFRSDKETVAEATVAYEGIWSSLAPIEVRTALLGRLRAEEALTLRELRPREESLRMAAWLAGIGLVPLLLLAADLAF